MTQQEPLPITAPVHATLTPHPHILSGGPHCSISLYSLVLSVNAKTDAGVISLSSNFKKMKSKFLFSDYKKNIIKKLLYNKRNIIQDLLSFLMIKRTYPKEAFTHVTCKSSIHNGIRTGKNPMSITSRVDKYSHNGAFCSHKGKAIRRTYNYKITQQPNIK